MENPTQQRRGRPPISNKVIRVGGAIALPALLLERGIDAAGLVAQVGDRCDLGFDFFQPRTDVLQQALAGLAAAFDALAAVGVGERLGVKTRQQAGASALQNLLARDRR